MDPLVPQAVDEAQVPDLDIIVRGYQSIANELPKFRNLPAFNQGANILEEMRGMREEMRGMREEMRGMREEMRGMREEMNEKFEVVNERIDRFDGRFKAMEVNNVARLMNRTLVQPDGQLSPLHNVATNEPIDRFPATPGAIKDMSAATLNAVLRALGIETNGVLEQKRQKLRVQIGLKALPV